MLFTDEWAYAPLSTSDLERCDVAAVTAKTGHQVASCNQLESRVQLLVGQVP